MESEKVIQTEEKINNMSKKELSKLQKIEIGICIICIILGTILHFTFAWSNENLFVASFSAVNESVWEHLKLAFIPMFLAAIVQYFFIKNDVNNYIEAKTIGIFASISFITVFFFTYTGILGTSFILVDILTFIASIIIGEMIAYKLMIREDESSKQTKILATIISLFLLICFIVFTYCPPQVNLFKDPTNGSYGIKSENLI